MNGTAEMKHAEAAVLIAEDDPDDRELMREAFAEVGVTSRIDFVEDGMELLDYLHGRGRYEPASAFPTPRLIVLDLNMPRKDGREALADIKGDPALRDIPVVIMTTSRNSDDRHIAVRMGLGTSAFVTKPNSFGELLTIVEGLRRSWLDPAVTPAPDPGKGA